MCDPWAVPYSCRVHGASGYPVLVGGTDEGIRESPVGRGAVPVCDGCEWVG